MERQNDVFIVILTLTKIRRRIRGRR